MITSKKVIAAAAKFTGVKPEYIELIKDEGFWYWGGKAGSLFDSCMTYNNLNDVSLERWAEDFESRVQTCLLSFNAKTMNDLIEEIDWNIEYDK